MTIADIIHQKLTAELAPAYLEVIDDSARHRGHRSAPQEGESHFNLVIVSASFEGLGAVARHRLVNRILADELRSRVHALSMKIFTPAEMERNKSIQS